MPTQNLEIKTYGDKASDAEDTAETPALVAASSTLTIETIRKGVTVAAVAMLVFALEKHPYNYYVILRYVVCGTSAWNSLHAHKLTKHGWVWLMFGIAILFNPVIPIHLSRNTWANIDLFAAGALAVYLCRR